MHEHQLRCFLEISESGSVSQAAGRLEIAQPTLSQLLLRLEDELTVKLFERNARGVSLTEAGHIFKVHARKILNDMVQAREEVHGAEASQHTSVILGLPCSISTLIGARLIILARERYPRIAVHLAEAMSQNIRERLEKGGIDIGILHDGDTLRHLSARHLATEDLLLVGPPGRFGAADWRAGHEPLSLAANDFPLVLAGEQHGLRQFINRGAQSEGIPLKVEIELDSLPHMKTLVSSGHGYTILAHAAVQDDLEAGRLSAIRMVEPTLQRRIYLVRSPNRAVTRASVQIEDLLVYLMRGMIADGTWAAQWVGPAEPRHDA